MQVFLKTDIGMMRTNNQDSVDAGVLGENSAWALICDGMGGANGGEFASGLAVEIIRERLLEGYSDDLRGNEMTMLLRRAIAEANKRVYESALDNPALNGMGTTVVLAVVSGGLIYTAHVGDSRAYIINEQGIRRITKDHSLVQEMVDSGELTESEAVSHPRKNVITRALGVSSYIDIDFGEYDYNDKDIVLICTDGLTNHVSDDDIYELFMSFNADELCDKLVEEANINGGKDNISVAIVCESDENEE